MTAPDTISTQTPEVIGFVLVGAEGMPGLWATGWCRDATTAETAEFCLGKGQGVSWRDSSGRPYWLVAVYNTAPEHIQNICRHYIRVVRLDE